jgi:carbon-monoxide dehydrogenase medium subunit
MKAARFTLERPRSLDEALALAGETSGSVKILAGGQSLGPMLNLRLVEPDLVVDIAGLAELRRFDREGGALVIGACVTHADIEDGRVPDVGAGALARVASGIAYRAVRNRGTMGGSLSHADPAADWVSSLMALGAEVEIASRDGRRRVELAKFITGALETALAPGELLVAVRIPEIAASAGFGYVKHARKIGEFAHAIGAALIDSDSGTGRVVIGALDAPPVVIDDLGALLGGLHGDFASRFDRRVAEAALVAAGMSDAADRHIHVEVLRRAVLQAVGSGPANMRAAA